MFISILKWLFFFLCTVFLYSAIYIICVKKKKPLSVLRELFEDSVAKGLAVILLIILCFIAAVYLIYVMILGVSLF